MMRHKTHLPQIEFAPHRWSHWLATSRISLMLFAVLIIVCMAALREWRQLDQTRSQAQSRLRMFDHAKTTVSIPQPDRDQPTAKEIEDINRLITELNFPWFSLLNALERNKPQDIALLSIEPAAEKSLVVLQAEAKDAPAMLAYVDTLKSHPRFIEAELIKHDTNVQNPYRPIRFTVRLEWNRAS